MVLLVLGTGLFLLARSIRFPHWPQVSSPSLAEVSRYTAVSFPSGARLTNSCYLDAFSGQELFARIEIAPAQVDPFVKSIRRPERVTRKGEIGLTHDRIWLRKEFDANCSRWWHPWTAKRFTDVYARPTAPVGILIDRDDPHRAVLYVYSLDP